MGKRKRLVSELSGHLAHVHSGLRTWDGIALLEYVGDGRIHLNGHLSIVCQFSIPGIYSVPDPGLEGVTSDCLANIADIFPGKLVDLLFNCRKGSHNLSAVMVSCKAQQVVNVQALKQW